MESKRSGSRAWIAIGIYVVGGILLAAAFGTDWKSSRPIAEFAETFTAMLLFVARLAVPLIVSVWLASKIKHRVGAWVVGVALFLTLGIATSAAVSSIPGIGWRVDRMTSSEGYE